MPRTKRYQNLQKSVKTASSSQGIAQPLSPVELPPAQESVQAATQLTHSVRAATSQWKRVGSPQHWTVDAIGEAFEGTRQSNQILQSQGLKSQGSFQDISRAKHFPNLQKSVQHASSSQGNCSLGRGIGQPSTTSQGIGRPSTAELPPGHRNLSFCQPRPWQTPSVQNVAHVSASQPPPSVQSRSQHGPSVQSRSQHGPSVQAATQFTSSVQAATTSQPDPSIQAKRPPSLQVQSRSQHGPSIQAATQLPSSVQAETHLPHSVPSTSQPGPSVQAATQPPPSVQSASQLRRIRRESLQHWTVDAIDSQGAIKRLRVKVKNVLNLPRGERIVVEFDDDDLAVGEGDGVLAGFCGLLATDCSLFPINFVKWPDLPESYFNGCFDRIIKPRFYFRTTELNARHFVNESIGRKWAAGRQRLWNEFFSPLKTKSQMMENVPAGVPRDQWTSFINYRFDPKTVEMCMRNAANRKLQTSAHNGGSKSNARRRAEIMAETGQKPGRAKMYLITHRNEDGSYVNEAVKEICEKIELAVSQSTTDESEVSPNDAVGKVLGPEHPGRVRCMGLGAVPSKVFKQSRHRFSGINASLYDIGSCSSHCNEKYNQILNAHNQSQEKYSQVMAAHNQMMNAFKAYMIMKEGTIPEQFSGIFVSPPLTTPSDAASGHKSPVDTRRSCSDSYPNDNHGSI